MLNRIWKEQKSYYRQIAEQLGIPSNNPNVIIKFLQKNS